VRMGHILIRAELDRVVCSGPRIGKQFTYTLFDERVSATKTIDRDEALARLTRLYLQSHGPATLQDFVWWSGLSTADAKRGLELVERSLEKVTIGEKVYQSIQSDAVSAHSSTAAHLLPVFDEYFVAYKDREIVFGPPDGRASGDTLGPAVVINGVAAGIWKRTNDKKSIEVNFTRALRKTERVVVDEAVARYAEFLGLEHSFR